MHHLHDMLARDRIGRDHREAAQARVLRVLRAERRLEQARRRAVRTTLRAAHLVLPESA
jgi:hypothetical protein